MKKFSTDYSSGVGVDKRAYKECQGSNLIPTDPNYISVEYSPSDYSKLASNDGNFAEMNCAYGGGQYPFHRFKIALPSNIKRESVKSLTITIRWKWTQGCI